MVRGARSSCGFSALLAAAILFAVGADAARATFPGRVGPLVFASSKGGSGDLFLVDPANGKTTRLTNTPTADDQEPAWSPDLGDGQIAFQSTRAGNTDIYVVDAKGKNEARLTGVAAADTEPAWSPDDNSPRITFVSARDGNPENYSMTDDGKDKRRLTNDPAADLDAA